MDRVSMPKLLPRPQYKKAYREPLEAFVDNSTIIIIGDRQQKIMDGRRLYENCRIFTAMAKRTGTKKQKKVFAEKPILDHLWIPEQCSLVNKKLGVPDVFAVGKIRWYSRKDGSKDLALSPVKRDTHLEVLFLGTVFIYGLHIIQQSKKILGEGLIHEGYKEWNEQLKWLRIVAKRFEKMGYEKMTILENRNMIKYVECFLNEIEKQIKKTESHFERLSSSKGFGNKLKSLK